MRTDDLYEAIRDRGGLESTEAAREAAQATLATLAERISHGEAEQLTERPPDGLAWPLREPQSDAESFGPDEFVSRVAEREGADDEKSGRHVRATIAAVGDRANRGEWLDVRRQLPESYATLYELREEH